MTKLLVVLQCLNKALDILLDIFRHQKKQRYDDEIEQIHKNPGSYFDDHFGRVSDYPDKDLHSDKTPESDAVRDQQQKLSE